MSDKDQKKDSKQNGTSERAPQVGALLRASRRRVGEDLRDVSDVLCIRYLYLEAIEECRYGDLPGNTYAVGFIRSYAEHLGLDGDEVVRRYRLEQAGQKNATDLAFPTPVPDSGVPKGAIVFVGVLIALLVYGGWYVTTTDDSILSDLISPVPDHLKHLVTGDDAPSGTSSDAPETQPDAATTSTTDAAITEVEKVVRETTEAAEQMANAAGEAAQRTAEAAAEAAATNTESAAEVVSETAQAASESAAEATDTVRETVAEVTETASENVAEVTEEVSEVAADTAAVTSDAVQATVAAVENVTREVTSSANETMAGPSDSASPTVGNTETTDDTVASASTEADAAGENASRQVESSTTDDAASAASDSAAAAAEATSPEQSTVETASAPAEPAAEPAADPVAEPEPAAAPKPAVREVTAEDLNALVLRQATGVSEQASSPPVPSASSNEAVATSGIVIVASTSSWVEIRDPSNNDNIVFTGLMSAGSSFNVPDINGLTLDTGNAGALDITIDGVSVPKIGGIGAVRKNVSLDAELLKAGTAASR